MRFNVYRWLELLGCGNREGVKNWNGAHIIVLVWDEITVREEVEIVCHLDETNVL